MKKRETKKPFVFFPFFCRYSLPFGNSRHSSYPCAPVDAASDAFGSAIACALKIMSMKSDDSEARLSGHIPAPTYVKVSAPLLYKPLPRMSSLVYIAPPIVKSASAIVATEPKTMEKDTQYMVKKIFFGAYKTLSQFYISHLFGRIYLSFSLFFSVNLQILFPSCILTIFRQRTGAITAK